MTGHKPADAGDRSKRIGNWIVGVGIAFSVLTAGGTAAMTYGATLGRVSTLESTVGHLVADKDNRSVSDSAVASALGALSAKVQGLKDQVVDFRTESQRSNDLIQRRIDGLAATRR